MYYIVRNGIHVGNVFEYFFIFQKFIVSDHLENFWIILVYNFNHFVKESRFIWYIGIWIK